MWVSRRHVDFRITLKSIQLQIFTILILNQQVFLWKTDENGKNEMKMTQTSYFSIPIHNVENKAFLSHTMNRAATKIWKLFCLCCCTNPGIRRNVKIWTKIKYHEQLTFRIMKYSRHWIKNSRQKPVFHEVFVAAQILRILSCTYISLL